MNSSDTLQKPTEDMLLPLQTIAHLYMVSHKICSLLQGEYDTNDSGVILSRYDMLGELIGEFEDFVINMPQNGDILISSKQFLDKAYKLREKLADYHQCHHTHHTLKDLVDIIQI